MEKEIMNLETELMILGIEELESRQEMALMALDSHDEGEGNSKCSKNDGCNTVSGCGSPA